MPADSPAPRIPARWRIDAAWLCAAPSEGIVIRDGSVWGEGARIEGWGRRRDAPEGDGRALTRIDGLLVPAFVNAHAHIELSCLRGAIAPRKSFPDWLSEIVLLKRREVLGNPAGARAAAREGLRELVANGCAWVGDIVSAPAVAEGGWIHPELIPGGHAWLEMIDFLAEHGPDNVAATTNRVLAESAGIAPLGIGLSPHAPYTTTPELLTATAAAAREHNLSVCIHLAETAEEIDMLRDGAGAMADYLRSFNVLPPGWRAPGCGAVELMIRTGIVRKRIASTTPDIAPPPPAVLVHCNALTTDEIAALRDYAACLVVCPGTHRYFARGEFPLEKIRRGGVPVALGTDSLSSNESLDMLREAAIACELTPSLDAATALALITDSAAAALGPKLARGAGRISDGGPALFAELRASADGNNVFGFRESTDWLGQPALREALVARRLTPHLVDPSR